LQLEQVIFSAAGDIPEFIQFCMDASGDQPSFVYRSRRVFMYLF
jgi:hypothetical protein